MSAVNRSQISTSYRLDAAGCLSDVTMFLRGYCHHQLLIFLGKFTCDFLPGDFWHFLFLYAPMELDCKYWIVSNRPLVVTGVVQSERKWEIGCPVANLTLSTISWCSVSCIREHQLHSANS